MMRRRSGFTLIELLAVLAALSVITALGTGLLFRVVDAWRTTALRMDLGNTVETVFASMQRDFDSVLSARRSGVPLHGEERTFEDNQRFWRMGLENDRVILPLEAKNPQTSLAEPIAAMYQIDRSGCVPTLYRVLGPLGANPPEGAQEELAQGVLSMRLEYTDGKTWARTWNRAALPEAVRVSLVLMDTDRPFEQISRKRDFTIYVE